MLWRGKGDLGPDAGSLDWALFIRQTEHPTPRPGRKSKETPYFQRTELIKANFLHKLKINSSWKCRHRIY
ncbi:MAG: hypothetical protein DMG76_19060 [Acidobacteria bacterium]|nr:MAG: hypothetical protein DMG76_19060 [Acidobacteriota bacterium]